MTPDDIRAIVREELAALGIKPKRVRKPRVARITWNCRSFIGVTDDDMQQWQDAYPAVAVPQAIRQIEVWLVANEHRRNQIKDFSRFILNWLSKEQRKADGRMP